MQGFLAFNGVCRYDELLAGIEEVMQYSGKCLFNLSSVHEFFVENCDYPGMLAVLMTVPVRMNKASTI